MPPRHFDYVAINDEGVLLTYEEFNKLTLRERCKLVLNSKVEFISEERSISKKKAMEFISEERSISKKKAMGDEVANLQSIDNDKSQPSDNP